MLKLRKSVKMAIDTLEALVDEDEETRMEARGLNIPLGIYILLLYACTIFCYS
jgi:hypothetical protein